MRFGCWGSEFSTSGGTCEFEQAGKRRACGGKGGGGRCQQQQQFQPLSTNLVQLGLIASTLEIFIEIFCGSCECCMRALLSAFRHLHLAIV